MRSLSLCLALVYSCQAFYRPLPSLRPSPARFSSKTESFIVTPAFRSVYPDLLENYATFGHVNIPLGSPQGRACDSLRRLHIQGKLDEREVEWLNEHGFYFYSLEQVYETANFDELFDRLLQYRDEHGDVSPPKKYQPDPELGAWVTGIRRQGVERVDPDHRNRLNAIDFLWTSPRVCGSAFMKQYREILQDADWKTKVEHQKWLRGVQEQAKRGTLSDTRKHYMQELLECTGDEWMEWNEPWKGK